MNVKNDVQEILSNIKAATGVVVCQSIALQGIYNITKTTAPPASTRLTRASVLLVALLTLLIPAMTVAHAQTNSPDTPIPNSYFGLTTLETGVTPALSYAAGTIRNLDSYFTPTSAQQSMCHPAGQVSPSLDWAYINRCGANVFDWTNLDAWVANATSNGQQIIFDLGATPAWASSMPNNSTYQGSGACGNPASLSSWDAWVWSVSNRYKGKIKYYELWNEPNSTTYWCGTIPQLALLGRDAFYIIQENDASAVFIGPAMTSSSGPGLLAQYYAAGGSSTVGGVAFHGYNFSGNTAQAEDVVTTIQAYKTVVEDYSLQNLPLLDTEDGWAVGSSYPTTPAEQADYLAKDMILQWLNGVQVFDWYAYDGSAQYGQLEAGGENALNAAGTAYQTVRSWINGANAAGCTIDSGNTYRCSFSKPAFHYNFIIVWNSTNSGPYVASGYSNYVGLDGVEHPISNGTVQVGAEPLLLE